MKKAASAWEWGSAAPGRHAAALAGYAPPRGPPPSNPHGGGAHLQRAPHAALSPPHRPLLQLAVAQVLPFDWLLPIRLRAAAGLLLMPRLLRPRPLLLPPLLQRLPPPGEQRRLRQRWCQLQRPQCRLPSRHGDACGGARGCSG